MAPPTHWPLPSARLQLTPSLLSAPGQISQTNIFQSQENSHTSISWNRRLAYSFELADKADWISINTTIQFPCQYFTLHILIHCFGSKHDISDDSHRQAEVLLGVIPSTGFPFHYFAFCQLSQIRHNHPSKEHLLYSHSVCFSVCMMTKNVKASCNQVKFSPLAQ